MPRKRVSSASRASRSTKLKVSHWLHDSLKKHLFVGISLGGGKTDKTSVALVEYYPDHEKIFLRELHEKIKAKGALGADQILFRLLEELKSESELFCYDVPLTLPKCMRCNLPCPGFEKCQQPEIKWMSKHYGKRNQKKRPEKTLTPYTERCAELYLSSAFEEPFYPSHALGSNKAPLLARAHYLNRRLKKKSIEVHPKASLWRVGRSLGIQKSHLRLHKHSASGEEARQAIVDRLVEKDVAFFYEADRKALVDNGETFDAFLCALTGVFKFTHQVEKKPRGFPRSEGWVEVPVEDLKW